MSDLGIQQWASEHPGPEIERCLLWGAGVNASIAEMVHGVPPFPGVREALEYMSPHADLMVVSATPVEALQREWTEHGLAEYMSVIAPAASAVGQECRWSSRPWWRWWCMGCGWGVGWSFDRGREAEEKRDTGVSPASPLLLRSPTPRYRITAGK